MDAFIKLPQTLKAKVMLWRDASYHDIEELDKMQSVPDLESTLSNMFEIDLPEPRRGVLLELFVQTVLFCRESNFKKEQTSALLSIIKSIHEANVETPLNNIEQCSEYCKELLLCHSVRRPPFSINLFSREEVTCILKYIHNSYIRHYKLYKYIFTQEVKIDMCITYSDQEEPPPEDPPPDAPAPAAASPPEVSNEKECSAEHTEIQETPATETEGATLGSKAELKALIEQEVREQMMVVSGHLDQRVKEIADQHHATLDSAAPHSKAKSNGH